MKIAIMQPAFIPPASYFRLFAAADLFVVLDDVQFNRRWYTHRQKLTARNGKKEWMTLPIKRTSRDATMITDLQWAAGINEKWDDLVENFPIFPGILPNSFLSPVYFVTKLLRQACIDLDIYSSVHYSSTSSVPSELRGQDKIINLCRYYGATEYINSPGGRGLYDEDKFKRNGIKLTFLPEYKGSYDSILERLDNDTISDVRKEIYDNL